MAIQVRYMSSVLTSVICEGLTLQIKLQKYSVACLSRFLLVVMSRDDGFLWYVCQRCKNSAASLPQKLCEALVTTPPYMFNDTGATNDCNFNRQK